MSTTSEDQQQEALGRALESLATAGYEFKDLAPDEQQAYDDHIAVLTSKGEFDYAFIPGYTPDPEKGLTHVELLSGERRAIPVCIQVLGRAREDGVIRGTHVTLTERDGTTRGAFIDVKDMGGRDVYGKLCATLGHGFTDAQMKYVTQLLLRSTTLPGVTTIETLAQPRWNGDRFEVPGITHLPSFDDDGTATQHYGPRVIDWPAFMSKDSRKRQLVAGEDADARDAWRYVMWHAAKNPKLGLVIGAALASPYLCRLNDVRGTVVHVGGVSTKGKTRSARIGIATMGSPNDNKLLGSWDSTYAGVLGLFARSGGIAYVLDETSHVTVATMENLSLVPYAVTQGMGRLRADREGEARESHRFNLNVISTGEDDLAKSKGGEYARVVQLNAPLIEGDDDGATIDTLHQQAVEYAGWPLRWFVDSEWAPTEIDLKLPRFEHPIARRHTRQLAAIKLAFDKLCELLWPNGDGPTLDIEAATRELVSELAESSADSDRLFSELWTDFNSRKRDYGTAALGLDVDTVVGRDCGMTWVVTTKRVTEVATRIGISDFRPAIRDLVKRGKVLPGSKGNRARKALREGDPVVDVYEFVKSKEVSGGEEEAHTGAQAEDR